MYTLQSLWTQAREGLDVTTVILANRSYAILNLELSRVGAEGAGPRALAMLDLCSRRSTSWRSPPAWACPPPGPTRPRTSPRSSRRPGRTGPPPDRGRPAVTALGGGDRVPNVGGEVVGEGGDEAQPPRAAASIGRSLGDARGARRLGKAARAAVPRSHGEWAPAAGRDPVAFLEEQAADAVPELVPIRHGRMVVSPFTYFRGAALSMASDLDHSASGITVQLCGDAHLAELRLLRVPERHLFFDVNDFDETAPGPWEWDVKRLAASLEVAAATTTSRARNAHASCVERPSYRETMREFAIRPILEVWYAHLDIDELLPRFESLLDPERTPSVWASIVNARAHDSLQAFGKLCHVRDGEPRIVHDPPLIVPIEDLLDRCRQGTLSSGDRRDRPVLLPTLQPDRRRLLEQYRFVHLARKVVGVGSVGTEAWIALLADHDHESPLFLQIKEAEARCSSGSRPRAEFSNHGQRVVAGQRLIQAASDIFLGWDRVAWDGAERDYYFRQLRDWKGSADIAGMTPAGMDLWGRMCGWTLARAHARTGDRIAIAAYLGKSDTFDRAIADFSVYADQNERDHRALQDAVTSGRVGAETGI